MSVFPSLDYLNIEARYPKSIIKIKEWLFSQDELMKQTENFVDPKKPEESKRQFVGMIIQMDPRKLYDVFDALGIYISVTYNKSIDVWTFYNSHQEYSYTADTRIQAEQTAFHDAFEYLEKTL